MSFAVFVGNFHDRCSISPSQEYISFETCTHSLISAMIDVTRSLFSFGMIRKRLRDNGCAKVKIVDWTVNIVQSPPRLSIVDIVSFDRSFNSFNSFIVLNYCSQLRTMFKSLSRKSFFIHEKIRDKIINSKYRKNWTFLRVQTIERYPKVSWLVLIKWYPALRSRREKYRCRKSWTASVLRSS